MNIEFGKIVNIHAITVKYTPNIDGTDFIFELT